MKAYVSMMVKTSGPVVVIALSWLSATGCSGDSKDSKAYKELTQSRNDVITGARKIRDDSRVQAQPSENFFGDFYRCPEKSRVHYSLETDWITPKNDADDMRTFDYVVKTLQSSGWVASSVISRRERTMRHKNLEIRISIRPGAAWITGILGGPCYKLENAADHFLDRPADQLSG